MLVNPKKLDRIEIDKDNQKMKDVNGVQKASLPNIMMFLFKHLTDRKDIINLMYNLDSENYSANFTDLVLTKMVEKIKDYFVTYTSNTSYIRWNRTNEGLFAFVLDPNYKKNDGGSFTDFALLLVGGFNPTISRTITFKNEKITQTEVMESNWKLRSYNYLAPRYPHNISVPIFVKAIKFMIGWHRDSYKYIPKTPTENKNITN